MNPIPVIVAGLGNIGRHAIHSIEHAPDMECLGVLRTPKSLGTKQHDLRGIPEFTDLASLCAERGKPRVAILCCPSRLAPKLAEEYLDAGIGTVDSFDIHDQIPDVVKQLDKKAKNAGIASIVSAGWDPGTDSVFRALFEAMVPAGTTFTNFGRGRSMGHSVAARAVAGVADAVSITIPVGGGRHSRLVYVLPEKGMGIDEIAANIKADPYFAHDELDVRAVKTPEQLDAIMDDSHGVLLERTGASGAASNQRLAFDMRIDNPALTAQVMVACARAVTRMTPGCHTLIDLPPVALLPGERMEAIRRLV